MKTHIPPSALITSQKIPCYKSDFTELSLLMVDLKKTTCDNTQTQCKDTQALKKQMDSIEKTISNLNSSLNSLHERVDNIEKSSLNSLEKCVNEMGQNVKIINMSLNSDNEPIVPLNCVIKGINESIINFRTIIEQPRHIYYVNDIEQVPKDLTAQNHN